MKINSWCKNKVDYKIILSILFALYVVVPAVVLCFTVDNQTARIYTTNTLLVNNTNYRVYYYDWWFLASAYCYIVFSMLIWAIYQYLIQNYPKLVLHNPEPKDINLNSLLGVVFFSYVFAFFIAVGARISLQWYFILIIFAYLIPYTFVCQQIDFKFRTPVPKRKSDTSTPVSSPLDTFLTILCLVVFSLLLSIYYVQLVSNSNLILVTKLSIAIGVVIIVFVIIYLLKNRKDTIHIHHFIWGTMVVLITGLDSWFMLLIQAFAIAVHLHGLCVYGYDHVVYNNINTNTIPEESVV